MLSLLDKNSNNFIDYFQYQEYVPVMPSLDRCLDHRVIEWFVLEGTLNII